MKKYIRFFVVFLLLLCSHPNLFGQLKQRINIILKGHNFNDVRLRFDSLRDKKGVIEVRCKYLRELTDNFSEAVYYFTEDITKKHDRIPMRWRYYRLTLLTKGDTIILYQMGLSDGYKEFTPGKTNWDPSDVYRNDSLISRLKASFKNNFHANLNEDDLFLDNISYGENCGFGGLPPEQKVQMDLYVNNSDTANLIKLLQSANVEKQFYGVLGFSLLEKKGLQISDNQKKIINLIFHKKGGIQVCSGCTVGYKSVSEVAKDFTF